MAENANYTPCAKVIKCKPHITVLVLAILYALQAIADAWTSTDIVASLDTGIFEGLRILAPTWLLLAAAVLMLAGALERNKTGRQLFGHALSAALLSGLLMLGGEWWNWLLRLAMCLCLAGMAAAYLYPIKAETQMKRLTLTRKLASIAYMVFYLAWLVLVTVENGVAPGTLVQLEQPLLPAVCALVRPNWEPLEEQLQ